MKSIYLLRHGFSVANSLHLVNGTIHDPLTALGVQQAQAAAQLILLHDLHFTHYFVSNWKRAQETAAHFLPGVSYTVDARLGETNPGIAHNMTFEELNQKYPEFLEPFNPDLPYPGGESHQQLYDRSVAWFTEISANMHDNESVLAVTHAGPITSIIQYVCKVSMKDFPQFVPNNATLSKITSTQKGWKLEYFGLMPPKCALS